MTLSLQKCRAAGFLPVLERDEGTAVGGEHQIALRKAHLWAFGLDARAGVRPPPAQAALSSPAATGRPGVTEVSVSAIVVVWSGR